VFVTERFGGNLETLEHAPLRLARLDLATKTVRPIAAFVRGKHLSPSLTADGSAVTFVADPDGISNLYRIGIDGGPIEKISSVPTGVAGITASSPALSASRTGRLAFSVFEADGHAVYVLDPEAIVSLVPPVADGQAAMLPGRTVAGGDVQGLLANHERGLPPAGPMPAPEPYQRSLALDAIGQPTVSASVSGFGNRVYGGISAIFSDMLGDRGLGVQGQIGGTFADFGGQLIYMSRRHRWNWAASVAVMPYSIGYLTRTDDPATGETYMSEVIERQTARGAFLTTAFPFNVSTRIEFSGGFESLTFSREVHRGRFDVNSRRLVDITRETSDLAQPLHLAEASAALVHDTSFFGATGPVYGTRARLEVGQTSGSLHYATLLADWRRYFMPVQPFTVSVRGLHYGRYGRNSEHDQLLALYTGYPEFVHGYGVGSFTALECLRGAESGECNVFRGLLGSRLLVANVEVRAPIPGVFRGQLEYGRVPLDVAAFFDAGVSWTSREMPAVLGGQRPIVRSAGAAIRANLFGLLILELSASRPLDRPHRSLQWQIGIRQGF
jgi:hypothetical protein